MTEPRSTPMPARPADPPGRHDRAVTTDTLVRGAAILVLLALAWLLADILLLVFAAILIAIALRAGAGGLHRLAGLNIKLGVLLVLLAVLAAIAGVARLAGPSIAEQFRDLLDALPQSWQTVTEWLPGDLLEGPIEEQLPKDLDNGAAQLAERLPDMMGVLSNALNAVLGSVSSILLMLIAALYIALETSLYRKGAIRLVPLRHRDKAGALLDEMGSQLGRWMAGQAVDMVIVAILAGLGLWLLEVPLALILALIAGLTNIVPIVGPLISGGIAVLVALPQGMNVAVYVAILFTVIQVIEGNILMPLIQRYAVQMPPALTIIAIVAFGSLFGAVGVILGTPLLVVVLLLVRRIYVQEVLGDPDVG